MIGRYDRALPSIAVVRRARHGPLGGEQVQLRLCKIEVVWLLRCSGGSGTIMMFPAAKPPGWPPAPNSSRRIAEIDQHRVSTAMGFCARYVHLRKVRHPLAVRMGQETVPSGRTK